MTEPRAGYRCPRCNGVGRTIRPPWVPGDVDTWMSTTTQDYECSLCDGIGLVFVAEDREGGTDVGRTALSSSTVSSDSDGSPSSVVGPHSRAHSDHAHQGDLS